MLVIGGVFRQETRGRSLQCQDSGAVVWKERFPVFSNSGENLDKERTVSVLEFVQLR